MALFKKGTCRSALLVSSIIYVCKNCGHTKVVKDDTVESSECPKCHSGMEILSSHTEPIETSDNKND